MLRPSYSELMNLLNSSQDTDSEITSRYTIVIAAAKRARQLIDGAEPMARVEVDKAVSIAVQEMAQGKLKIKNRFIEGDDDMVSTHTTEEMYHEFITDID